MISIIILTYNSDKYIERLLDSLLGRYKDDIQNKGIEVLVADNDSSDNTVAIVKKYNLVSLINNGGNLGFAKGNNAAVKKAKGNYVLFINPDAEFTGGDIKKLFTNFEKDKIGVVGGRILSFNGSRELSCGKFYTLLNIFFLCLGLEEKLGVRFSPDKSKFVDYVSGGFMGVDKEIFVKNGGFDEHYFMYVEDQDLCFRLGKKGFKTFFSDDAVIKHVGQGSSNRAFAIINIYKGLSYFQKKHMNKFSYFGTVFLLGIKAHVLHILGIVIRNKYLADTYGKAARAI